MEIVENVMTPNPIVAEIPGNRNEVLKTMVKHNLTGLPVIKRKDGKLAGMITRQDIFEKPDEDQLALIMNKAPETIGPDDPLSKAAAIFRERRVHHLPVVEGNSLVGILTPTNLLGVVEGSKITDAVEQIVHSPCVPVHEGAPLSVALITFKVSKASALPVLDDTGGLTGILTDRDIFNKSHIDGSMAISDLGIGEDEDEWTWEGLRNIMKLWYEVSKIELPSVTVKDIMVKDPTTVFRKTSVSEAARIMRKNDFGQLPIRDSKDQLLAMIYDIDVASSLAEVQ
ncbi:MAG: CBS domain-containing protein [Methanomassiliicoccales archaeon]